jgi:hypothetical protein
MTPNPSEVEGIDSYSGIDTVMVGNGNGLSIVGIGHTNLPTTTLKLNNVLVVPDIKRNCYLYLNLYEIITVTFFFISIAIPSQRHEDKASYS